MATLPIETQIGNGITQKFEPKVSIKLGKETYEFTPEEATRLGRDLIAMSEKSISDAFIIHFLVDEVKLERNHVPRVLGLYNKFLKKRKVN